MSIDESSLHGTGGRLGAVVDAELGDEVRDVGFDGAGADEEGFGDLAVRLSLGKEAKDVTLAGSQVKWLRGADRWRGTVW